MRFEAQDLALQIIRCLRPLVAKLRRRDPDQARQIRRAGNSINNNIAEGNRRHGGDRPYLFSVARGSAAEVTAELLGSVLWGDLTAAEVAEVLELLDRERAVVYRLIHPRG